MALYPFMLLKRKEYSNDEVMINHELIHFRQQLEMLIIFFYLLYLINYLVNLFIYRAHDEAYRNIIFEREAYREQSNFDYLSGRRFLAWLNY